MPISTWPEQRSTSTSSTQRCHRFRSHEQRASSPQNFPFLLPVILRTIGGHWFVQATPPAVPYGEDESQHYHRQTSTTLQASTKHHERHLMKPSTPRERARRCRSPHHRGTMDAHGHLTAALQIEHPKILHHSHQLSPSQTFSHGRNRADEHHLVVIDSGQRATPMVDIVVKRALRIN